MQNKYGFLVGLLFVGLLVVGAGCKQNKLPIGQDNNSRGQMNGRNVSSTFDNFLQNTTTGTLENLVLGEKILVFGITNSDGSISSNRLVLGELPNISRGLGDRQASVNGELEKSQRMIEGRPQFNGRNGQDNNGVKRTVSSVTTGEIIKNEDSSLILKTVDGGSKIVFYSDKTQVLIFQSPTTSPTVIVSTTPSM